MDGNDHRPRHTQGQKKPTDGAVRVYEKNAEYGQDHGNGGGTQVAS